MDRARVPSGVKRLRRVLAASGLGPAHAVRSVDSLQAGLDALPFVGLPAASASRFPDVLEYPLHRGLSACAPEGAGSECPVLAAPAAVLLDLARRARRGRPRVEFAVLVLRHPGDSEVTESERDLLWESFQVPVYAVLCGFDGQVLAHECEAQCGLHATPHAVFEAHDGRIYVTSLSDLNTPTLRVDTGMAGRIDSAPCDCGRPGLRVTAASGPSALSSAAD